MVSHFKLMRLYGTTLIERVLGHVSGVPADFAGAHHQFSCKREGREGKGREGREGRLIITGSYIYSVRFIYSFI